MIDSDNNNENNNENSNNNDEGNITNLKIVKFNSINNNLIEVLEDLLERAKTGELQTFAGVGLLKNNTIITGKSYGEYNDIFRLLGGVTNLQFEINLDIE